MITLTLYTRFNLSFKTPKHNIKKIEKLLNANGFLHQTWQRLCFEEWIEFRVECNIRQAELLRQLIKNFKTFE